MSEPRAYACGDSVKHQRSLVYKGRKMQYMAALMCRHIDNKGQYIEFRSCEEAQT